MKLGIMNDIHGNIIALESLLEVFEREKCEGFVCCGDLVGIGPCPEETVQRVKNLPNLRCVKGNHDEIIAGEICPPYPEDVSEGEIEQHIWIQQVMSRNSIDFLKGLTSHIMWEQDGLNIVALHYPMGYPQSGKKKLVPLFRNPNIAQCKKEFQMYPNADIILYGHDHDSSVVRDGSHYYINCGSVGCPPEGKQTARGGILDISRGEAVYYPVEAVYDIRRVGEQADRLQYPNYQIIKKCFYGI